MAPAHAYLDPVGATPALFLGVSSRIPTLTAQVAHPSLLMRLSRRVPLTRMSEQGAGAGRMELRRDVRPDQQAALALTTYPAIYKTFRNAAPRFQTPREFPPIFLNR